jgi:hypothetical protein
VSKITPPFKDEEETSGEGDIDKVSDMSSIQIEQSASVERILFVFSPGPVAKKGAGERRINVSSPTLSSKVKPNHLQYLEFRAIATCKLNTTLSSRDEVGNSQHLQIPQGFTF